MSKYPNSGTLGKNERQRPDKNDPDYTGQAEIDCECPKCGNKWAFGLWLSSWIKAGPNGKFMSLSFKPKQAQAKTVPVKSPEPEFNDEIPF